MFKPMRARAKKSAEWLAGFCLAGIDRTIKILHALGYADPIDWSNPMPIEKPNQWMVIMTKTVLLE